MLSNSMGFTKLPIVSSTEGLFKRPFIAANVTNGNCTFESINVRLSLKSE